MMFLDPKRILDVIDVPTQSEVVPKWTMEQWANYYHTPAEERKQILNVISLEFSQTPLMQQVRSPGIVRYRIIFGFNFYSSYMF
jgi:hypothetical protein